MTSKAFYQMAGIMSTILLQNFIFGHTIFVSYGFNIHRERIIVVESKIYQSMTENKKVQKEAKWKEKVKEWRQIDVGIDVILQKYTNTSHILRLSVIKGHSIIPR